MKAALPWVDADILFAVVLRELRAALANRSLQVFSALAVGGGIAAVVFSEAPNASAFFLVQIALYFVSFFAVLVGVSSARAEQEEWPLLFAQPISRTACVLAKFATLWGIFSVLLVLLFLPAVCSQDSPGGLALLYVNTLGLAAVFGSLGLCAGIFGHDRVQALVIGVTVWLFLLVGVDLIALFAAQWGPWQKTPDLWVSLLMANTLDAFRIQALFAMEQIPTEAANKTPLAGWWLSHATLWFAIISAAWTAVLLFLSSRRIEQVEM